jgi:glutaredoxin
MFATRLPPAVRLLFAVTLLGIADEALAKPEVTMYGASWCGPCRAVRAFLTRHSISFDYRDIDSEENRARFRAVTGTQRGIPLVLIDGERVRGANLKALRMILERKGIQVGAAQAPRPGQELYGGHPASWWQTHFAALRKRVAEFETRVEQFDAYAQTHYDRDVVLGKMKEDLEILNGALDQLEIDASRVALPRRYRAY